MTEISETDTASGEAELKVGAHVLVQLGSELVTDVEQAILECVKNAYDADSPSCVIDINTLETGVTIETGSAARLTGFDRPAETVRATLLDAAGAPLTAMSKVPSEETIQRRLNYTGRITIEDTGDGLTPNQLKASWLVVSRSAKRNLQGGRKGKTKAGRTPLGDKGLGRLGSMKLGDILHIETATSPDGPLSTAQFRWTDCESAETVDQIPVFMNTIPNPDRFKGTRVSVFGLKDLTEWRRKGRIDEITRSLAKLISPFEATSTFPVGIKLDDVPYSLASVTEDVLSRAIAEFRFDWQTDPANPALGKLVCSARFKRKLFTSDQAKHLDRTKVVFEQDQGKAFGAFLPTYRRLKGYDAINVDLEGAWFVTVEQTVAWTNMRPDRDTSIADPGPFTGAFYFFHMDKIDDDRLEENQAGDGLASGLGVTRQLIRNMSGISILRDGFRVRSQGDWLELSSGMTSGSTYNMRVDNTVGYFALSGEQNFSLTEKSDREGFVEDAAYRGFLQIARQARKFSNDALTSVRRALDDYYNDLKVSSPELAGRTIEGSLVELEKGFLSARQAKDEADRAAGELESEIKQLELEGASASPGRAIEAVNRAVRAIDAVRSRLSDSVHTPEDVGRIRRELDTRSDQAIALFESAAVGLSARGLAHELRTHLSEIRHRAAALEKEAKVAGGATTLPHLRAIRSSCAAISNAAALIDPMLPRSRTVKETMSLKAVLEEYRDARVSSLERVGVALNISGDGPTIRANRPRLIQVVDNLVRNSLYWLKRGAEFGGISRPKAIDIALNSTGFIVTDTGPGVDPHYEDSLFEIFVTAKPDPSSGQGLGLFIVKELLAVDGGDVVLLHDRNGDGRRYRFAIDLSSISVRG